jgi:hypothetical protein
MSSIGPGDIGGWFGSGGWYRATGESVTSPDGSIAWKYVNPYTWFDGCDRNEGNEVVMWAIELRTPLTVAPVPRGLYLVHQTSSDHPTFPILPTPPKDPPIDVITNPTDPGGSDIPQVPEPSYALLTAMMLVLLIVLFRRRVRA